MPHLPMKFQMLFEDRLAHLAMPNIYALTVFGVVSALGYVLNRQQKPDLNEPPNSRQDV